MTDSLSAVRPVADTAVASDAVKFLVFHHAMRRNLADEITMTVQAISIEDAGVSLPDSNRFPEILQCERLGVVIAVGHLRQPFAEEIVRHMAVVAGGKAVVAGLLPAFELLAHDVAVYACTRVIGKIAGALRKIKCVSTRSREHSDENRNQ